MKSSLPDRLAQPRSLAADFATIMAFVAMSAHSGRGAPAGWRHHHYATDFNERVTAAPRARANAAGDPVIGEHRGFSAIVVDANSGRTLYLALTSTNCAIPPRSPR